MLLGINIQIDNFVNYILLSNRESKVETSFCILCENVIKTSLNRMKCCFVICKLILIIEK